MKRTVLRKTLCILLACVLACTAAFPAFAGTPAEDAHLHFNADGKFRILNFSDFQDGTTLDSRVKTFIRQAVYTAQPDLIVLTGDNIYGRYLSSYEDVETAIAQFMDIFEALGVPVAIVFGNHDDDQCGVSKEEQMKIYNRYSVSISYDEGGSMEGCGTYNVPIYGSTDRNKVMFNLWMFDTGSPYNALNSAYDYMKESQLDWYVRKSNELKAANGGKAVQSIAFQHIIVNDIYNALKNVPSGTPGAVTKDRGKHAGEYYVLPDTAAPGSVMREAPSPSTRSNEREFSYIKQQGDVLAIVSGHDHRNMFVVPYQGVDLINTPAAGFYDFYLNIDVFNIHHHYHGDDDTRGARIIDINEEDVSGQKRYQTDMLFLQNLVPPKPQYYEPTCAADKYVEKIALCVEHSSQHGGSTEAALAAAYRRMYTAVDAAHGNGVALWADLNSDMDHYTLDSSPDDHVVICMGYTLTDNPANAMRALGLCYNENNPTKYDGKTANNLSWDLCCYHDLAVRGTNSSSIACNLNTGTEGNPIYFFANYGSSGSPITEIRIVNTGAYDTINMSDYPDDQLVYARFGSETGPGTADLNKSAWGDYIYALYRTAEKSLNRVRLNTQPLREARSDAVKHLKDLSPACSAEALAALQSALAQANAILRDLGDDNETSVYNQAAIDAATYRLVNSMLNLETTTTFTVTFDATSIGACDESSRTIVYGDFCGELPVAKTVPVDLHLNNGSIIIAYPCVRFDGWFTEREGGKRITPEMIFTATSDQTWYAHWSSLVAIANPHFPIGAERKQFPEEEIIGIRHWDDQYIVAAAVDVNDDGSIDLRDIALLSRHLAGGWDVDLDAEHSDVNADGKVNLRDVVLLRRYLAGEWDIKQTSVKCGEIGMEEDSAELIAEKAE